MRQSAAVRKTTTVTFPTGVACASLLLVLFFFVLPLPSIAGNPTDQVRATVEKVLAIVSDPNLKSPAQNKNLRAQLTQAIHLRFDFSEMAKRSLGLHWARRTAQEQWEFIKVFAVFLERLYADKIETDAGQNVLYTREIKDANFAEVDTKIVAENSREDLSVKYKLHRVDNEWKVYDLVIEDISLVNNYRSQFDRIIARSSFEGMVRVLQAKQSRGGEKILPLKAQYGGSGQKARAGVLEQSSRFASLAIILLTSVQDSRAAYRG